MDESKNISLLMTRYFSGDAQPEEAVAIHDWVKESGENLKTFQELSSIWYSASGAQYRTPPKPQAWNDLHSILDVSSRAKERKRHPYAVVALAASVLVIISLVALNIYFNRSHVPADVEMSIMRNGSEPQPLTLSDGSAVFLDEGSNLQYPRRFDEQERAISVIGNAYFSVKPDRDKPFTVTIPELKIEVVGTSFAVYRDTSASAIQVPVEKGIIKVMTAKDTIIGRAGQTVNYFLTTDQLVLLESININSFSYATRRFSFQDLSLSEILTYLQKAFGVQFALSDESIGGCRISADFDNETLEYIVNVIGTTLNLDHSIHNNTIYFSGNACE